MTGPLPATGSPGASGCMTAAAITAHLTHADTATVERFWTRVRTLGTPVDAAVPLVAPETGAGTDTGSAAGAGPVTDTAAGDTRTADATMQVTFLWRQERGATCDRVYLRVNRVTDKGREALGLMHHIPGTDVWVLTLDLAPTTRLSYGFVPLPPGTEPPAGPPPVVPRHLRPHPDLFNRSRPLIVHREGIGHSVYRGPLAGPLTEWDDVATTSTGRVHSTVMRLPGAAHPPGGGHPVFTPTMREKPLRLLLPAPPTAAVQDAPRPPAPVPLITMFDGEHWFDDLGLPAAIDAAVTAGRLPAVAVLGVGNADRADRVGSLGHSADLLRAVADQAIPWAEDTAAAHGVTLAPPGDRRRIVCGCSLGGLAALRSVHEAPGTWGGILAQSPSLWCTPGRPGRPSEPGPGHGETWFTRWILSHPRPPEPRPPSGSRPPEREPQSGSRQPSEPMPPDGHPLPQVRLAVGLREPHLLPHVHELSLTLEALGWPVDTRVYDGGHDDAWWRAGVIDGLESLLRGAS